MLRKICSTKSGAGLTRHEDKGYHERVKREETYLLETALLK